MSHAGANSMEDDQQNVRMSRHALVYFFSSRRRHTRFDCDWSSDVCSSDLQETSSMKMSMKITGAPEPISMAEETAFAAAEEVVSAEADGSCVLSWKFSKARSEERRVGKECRSRWSPYH